MSVSNSEPQPAQILVLDYPDGRRVEIVVLGVTGHGGGPCFADSNEIRVLRRDPETRAWVPVAGFTFASFETIAADLGRDDFHVLVVPGDGFHADASQTYYVSLGRCFVVAAEGLSPGSFVEVDAVPADAVPLAPEQVPGPLAQLAERLDRLTDARG